jgi:hypothetical protein
MRAWNIVGGIGLGAVAVGLVVLAGADADAAGARKRRVAKIRSVTAPLGLQGTIGAGSEVVVPFVLADRRGRPSDIEVQFGTDLSGNGVIEDDEFFAATENITDPRNTRKNRKPQEYASSRKSGRANAWVWSSLSDLGTNRFPSLEVERTPEGRVLEDPDNPGSPVYKEQQPGVAIRMRARRGRRKPRVSDWVRSAAFALDNAPPPSMTIDVAEPRPDGSVLLDWTAIHPDSEDHNGNGVLDTLQGEDRNQDGIGDFAPVSVYFDYFVLTAENDLPPPTTEYGFDPGWMPCTHLEGVGDPDDGVDSSPVGRPYIFAWDASEDLGPGASAWVVFRARPSDQKRVPGDFTLWDLPILVETQAQE